ncbi:MAG: 16S rRNA (guanine(527)-N(7))-methyltransferase RsmG [Desulfobacterales bacterium]|nr:16S rRNA (guanine(527)-N(7))-methyltransferase RsmG [Desulfobacterales bacterium]
MKIGSTVWRDRIRQGASDLGVPLENSMVDQYADHARLLVAWNRKINLTAITAPEDLAVKHFVDALASAPMIARGARVLDIGAGGGFPGIVLKVARPDLTMTLVDSVRKKVSFMQHVIRSLGMEGIGARHIRAESLAKEPGMAGAFDVVVCRALNDLTDFFEMARPLVASGGMAIAMKGRISSDELARAEVAVAGDSKRTAIQGWQPARLDVRRYRLPFFDADRALVRFSESLPAERMASESPP